MARKVVSMIGNYNEYLSFYFTEYFDRLPQYEKDKFYGRGLFGRIKRMFVSVGIETRRVLQKPASEPDADKTWIIVNDRNNIDAVRFLLDDNSFQLVTYRKKVATIFPEIRYMHFSSRLWYIPKMFVYLWSQRTLSIFSSKYDLFFSSFGILEVSRKYLSTKCPKYLIFTNDHNVEDRSLMIAARELGIRSVYIQHATVQYNFPRLIVDLALLEGEDSKVKYGMKGIQSGTDVKLVGMPKLDAVLQHRRRSDVISRLGIAFNTNDDLALIANVVQSIKNNLPGIHVSLRSHPKETRNISQLLDNGITYSDPAKESAFRFLLSHDAIVAHNSSIHLESVLLNRPAFYLRMTPTDIVGDLYGFVKNNLVIHCSSVHDLVERIRAFNNSPYDVVDRAKFYNSAVGSDWEGSSAIEIKKALNQFARSSNGVGFRQTLVHD